MHKCDKEANRCLNKLVDLRQKKQNEMEFNNKRDYEQKANENMIDFLKSSSTLSNSHSSQSIPKVPNKFKRSNSSSKINYLVPDPNANFVYFQPNDSDSYKISYLKKSYESRINKLLSNSMLPQEAVELTLV